MRVLLDCSHLNTGGAIQEGISILENAARTPAHEWHAVLSGRLAAQVPESLDRSLASAVRLPVRSTPLTKYGQIARRLPRIERAIEPQVVFTPYGPTKWRARVPHLAGFAIPHVLYPDTDVFLWQKGGRAFLTKSLLSLNLRWVTHALKNADYLVVETETMRKRTSGLHGFPASRTFVVHNGCSPVFVDSLARAGGAGARTRFTILVPSAYYPHKNLEVIPAVARELRALAHADFEFVMTLPPEIPGWRAIRRLAIDHGVGERIRTLGAVPHRELAERYRDADAVFLPTLLECSTAVYPETFAAGIPLATSALDFAKELCGDAALYFDPLSPAEAARALARPMAERELRLRLVENGRRVLRESYPSPEKKWEDQIACLEEGARRGKA